MVDRKDLLSAGIPIGTVLKIEQGKLDAMYEIQHWLEQCAVWKWRENLSGPPVGLTPVWDLNPGRFYLVYDGEEKDCLSGEVIHQFDVSVADLKTRLCFQCTREDDPWSEQYAAKSFKTAYRWHQALPVTPAMAIPVGGCLSLQGMHRFHLAAWYGVHSLPLLVRDQDVSALKHLIPKAIHIASHLVP